MSLHSHNVESDSIYKQKKPFLIWVFIAFFIFATINFSMIILVHSLGVMPKALANDSFFTSICFYLNFIGNLIFAIGTLLALFKMKKSALYWCLALPLFDMCSTGLWILTQNWLETASSLGLEMIFLVWSGCFSCFIYLLILNKRGELH